MPTARRSRLVWLVAPFTLAAAAAPAQADRNPDAQERAVIEETLTANGFTNWGEIEFDDGQWEVDDARDGDGGEWDLDLDAEGRTIIQRDDDD